MNGILTVLSEILTRTKIVYENAKIKSSTNKETIKRLKVKGLV